MFRANVSITSCCDVKVKLMSCKTTWNNSYIKKTSKTKLSFSPTTVCQPAAVHQSHLAQLRLPRSRWVHAAETTPPPGSSTSLHPFFCSFLPLIKLATKCPGQRLRRPRKEPWRREDVGARLCCVAPVVVPEDPYLPTHVRTHIHTQTHAQTDSGAA